MTRYLFRSPATRAAITLGVRTAAKRRTSDPEVLPDEAGREDGDHDGGLRAAPDQVADGKDNEERRKQKVDPGVCLPPFPSTRHDSSEEDTPVETESSRALDSRHHASPMTCTSGAARSRRGVGLA